MLDAIGQNGGILPGVRDKFAAEFYSGGYAIARAVSQVTFKRDRHYDRLNFWVGLLCLHLLVFNNHDRNGTRFEHGLRHRTE